jgi:hypothetical protein
MKTRPFHSSATTRSPTSRGAVAALTAIALLISAPAYAYVDPGTGGMLIQLVTGGVAGLLVLARLYWRRMRELFGRDPSASHESSRQEDPPRGAHDRG